MWAEWTSRGRRADGLSSDVVDPIRHTSGREPPAAQARVVRDPSQGIFTRVVVWRARVETDGRWEELSRSTDHDDAGDSWQQQRGSSLPELSAQLRSEPPPPTALAHEATPPTVRHLVVAVPASYVASDLRAIGGVDLRTRTPSSRTRACGWCPSDPARVPDSELFAVTVATFPWPCTASSGEAEAVELAAEAGLLEPPKRASGRR
jgi:hypothetical protein